MGILLAVGGGTRTFKAITVPKEFNSLTNSDGQTFEQFYNGQTFEELKETKELASYFQKVTVWIKLHSFDISENEILFSHLFTYGKEKELENKAGTKKYFSLALFFTCIERYVQQRKPESKDEKIANEINTPETSVIIIEAQKDVEKTQQTLNATKRRNNSKKAA